MAARAPAGSDPSCTLPMMDVVEGIRALKDCPLAGYLLDQPTPAK